MARKFRFGARGSRKVHTGCSTCKIRHKKCDEARPACSSCIRLGWKCDFVTLLPSAVPSQCMINSPNRSLKYSSAKPSSDDERWHMDYFQAVCAGEFSLFFELPAWRNTIIQGALAEPALHHAALAIGALASKRYYPEIRETSQTIAFSVRQYNLAIKSLHGRLDGSSQSLELAVLASIVFSYVEFLLGLDSQIRMHVQAGYAILENLHTKQQGKLATATQTGSKCQIAILSTRYSLLFNAVFQLTAQFEYAGTSTEE